MALLLQASSVGHTRRPLFPNYLFCLMNEFLLQI
jgi:hypothetical protein